MTPTSERGGAIRLRAAAPDDAAALDEICLRTGDRGGDATGLYQDPALLPAVWLRPYLAFAPELAVVAEAVGAGGRTPVGYVVGVADTAAFEEWAEAQWWPTVRAALRPAPEGTPDAALHERIHRPPRTPESVTRQFPAHLHVDLLPAAQGTGLGRELLEHFFGALRDRGVPGVHLGVDPENVRALGFYRRLGFEPLGAGLLGLTLT